MMQLLAHGVPEPPGVVDAPTAPKSRVSTMGPAAEAPVSPALATRRAAENATIAARKVETSR
jgi:hypothetical protein